ncbi:ribose ABC transporter permease [Cytobacillus firmus]|uniref:ABC transporter, permease protein (Cluster 2, ribose/xylose/arabinose/galactose) n=1 Tax=Cytobacillus firmus TaxID=1399 RepID=A0A800MWG6_CYTFI|nr:ribose ABC transporter permease [Cytobacillus firmus]KAF0823756.1 ABC transporter, permease protein (cluster 2, ribose/xylose/arabinose/galactose) [Cytobacillus firmus]MDD9310128.1 ribose ABC transporter permease [Cytobacillus firmus]MED1940444.1 ribose ABC transporter permease [Cytobacillus firmus]
MSQLSTLTPKRDNFPINLGYGTKKFIRDNMGILIGLFILCVVITIINPNFLTSNNLLNVLRQTSTNLYLALAMTMIIILGGIDLSVGSIMAVTGVVTTGMIALFDTSVLVAVLAGLLVGMIFGAINGYVAATTIIPPFIITLATMNIARGAAYVITDGKPVRVMSDSFNFLGSGYLFGILPMPVLYLIILLILCYFIMNKTKLGRYMYAVGGNAEAARFSGINIKKIQFFAYTFSGLMAAIAGIVLASRMFSGQPTAGEGAELDAIAAVVLGGTSMTGGYGRIGGTVIGALIIGVLSNGLNLMGVSSFWQYIVKGIVILVAVYADVIKRRKKA